PAQRLCAPAIDRPLLVPWLFVIDAAERPARFQLSGDAVDDFAGGPLAGAALPALAGDQTEGALMDDAMRLLRATDGPALARGEADYVDGRRQRYELAFAPLCDASGASSLAFGALGLDVLTQS
ncbi:MAG: PAS domain-containing protein, partial [Pseudomonadota bacterium]